MKIIHEEFIEFCYPDNYTSLSPSSVHASCLAYYRGSPYFACFGGTREGNPDVSIFIHHNGNNVITGLGDSLPRWNPILHVVNDKLFLWEKAGLFCDRWQTFLIDISDLEFDRNKEWHPSRRIIPAGLNGPVKTKPLNFEIKDTCRHIYCGSSVETALNWTSYIEVFDYNFEYCSIKTVIVWH